MFPPPRGSRVLGSEMLHQSRYSASGRAYVAAPCHGESSAGGRAGSAWLCAPGRAWQWAEIWLAGKSLRRDRGFHPELELLGLRHQGHIPSAVRTLMAFFRESNTLPASALEAGRLGSHTSQPRFLPKVSTRDDHQAAMSRRLPAPPLLFSHVVVLVLVVVGVRGSVGLHSSW